MGEALLGDPDDLRRILEGLDERNELLGRQAVHLDALTASVDRLTTEVVGLRAQVHDRPTQAEADRRRRRFAAGVILYALLLAVVVDVHVETCGPGARAERVIDALERGVTDVAVLRRVGDPGQTRGCDVVMPIHTHDRGRYPSRWNLLGWALYGVGGVALWAWQRPRVASADGPVSGGPDEQGEGDA